MSILILKINEASGISRAWISIPGQGVATLLMFQGLHFFLRLAFMHLIDYELMDQAAEDLGYCNFVDLLMILYPKMGSRRLGDFLGIGKTTVLRQIHKYQIPVKYPWRPKVKM